MIPSNVDALIQLALAEDVGNGDQTTLACIPAHLESRGRLLAKDVMVVAGVPFFTRVFQLLDPRVQVVVHCEDGTLVPRGTVVCDVFGPTRALLVGERTALNIIQRLCGVATLTRRFVEAVAGSGVSIADTRKTSPGMRFMQKYAVRCGGGSNHRFGLDSGVLIKDNHIIACGSLTAAVERARRQAPHLLKIEVEATTLALVDEAIAARADVILLDNMDTPMMAEAVQRIRTNRPGVLIEASGGLSLERLPEVAATGVDILSIGALTHSAPSADLSLEL
ncbi:MAG: carboxylating nicotinate-nucleotide diphosphorylase [Deltaproteobacteria bacterium]|nr:carboxylating nicotinate-nucleotide diphosphorylase [Deltaproteobacteria bacterium]